MASPSEIVNSLTPLVNQLDRVEITAARGSEASVSLSEKIRAELSKHEVVRSNMFLVKIEAPDVLRANFSTLASSTLPFICYRTDTGNLPGLQLNTSSVRRFGTGMEERKPTNAAVVDQQFSFIADREGIIYNFFYAWLNSIVVTDRRGAEEPGSGGKPFVSIGKPGNVAYKNTYATRIHIYVFDQTSYDTSDAIYEIILENAYPVFLGDVSLNWASNNELIRLPITFTYSHWYLNSFSDVEKTSADIGLPGSHSIIGQIYKAASAAAVLSSIRKPRSIQDILGIVNNTKVVLDGYGIPRGLGNLGRSIFG